jgi:hypothetical protein
MQREPIYAALWALLEAAYPWETSSRLLKHWSDIDSRHQPAMFMAQVGEQASTLTNNKTIWRLSVNVYVYANNYDNSGTLPSQQLNLLLDAITKAIEPDYPDVQWRQTLGGLVEYARIEGEIKTDEGVLGDQAVAIIPIQILTT